MFLETTILKRLFPNVFGDSEQVGGQTGVGLPPSPMKFLETIFIWGAFILYAVTYGRSVWSAFSCQGFVQGLLAVFFYPIYLMWNVTSLNRAIYC